MIRVAQVMECTVGGTRRHINELCAGLAAAGGFGVTLFASAERDPTFRRDLEALAARGVDVVEVPMVRPIRPAVDAPQQWRLIRAFRRGRFHVIHTHSSKAGALGRTAALLSRSRAALVHTPHTFAFNFTEQFSPRKRRFFLGVERLLGRATARMVHVSESERTEALGFGIMPRERTVVIPNGIDPAPYAAADGTALRRELGIPERGLLVGAVGLLNEAKGHAHLVAAAGRVLERVPDARFAIAGEGPLRGALEAQIARAGLGERVRLLGYRTDVPELLAALDVLAMPSLWEGLPYVVLEAMAAGLPVVATDVNGCRDVVVAGATGELVAPADPAALAEALSRVLADGELRLRFGRAGRARVAREFSLDAMLQHYVALYRSLVRSAA